MASTVYPNSNTLPANTTNSSEATTQRIQTTNITALYAIPQYDIISNDTEYLNNDAESFLADVHVRGGYVYDDEFWADIGDHPFTFSYNTPANSTVHDHQLLVNQLLPPLLMILGTLGNILTMVVLRRACFKHAPANIYLSVLAVGDTLVLWTGLFRFWVLMVWDFDVRLLSATVCKFHVFIVYWSFQFVSWITVVVAIDRLMTVCFIVPAKFCCTRNSAVSVIITIALTLLVLDVHLFFTVNIINVSRVNSEINAVYECVHHQKHSAFFTSVWPWMDAVVSSFVPSLIVMACNVYIVAVLVQQKRRSSVAHNKVSTLTTVLIIICILFCVTTMPIVIYQLPLMHTYRKFHDIDVTEGEVQVANFTFTFLYMCACVNNTVNFLVYYFCGERFRHELHRLFARKNKVHPVVIDLKPVLIVKKY